MSKGQSDDRSNSDPQSRERMGVDRSGMADRRDDDFFSLSSLGFRSQIFRDIDRWTDRMFQTFEDLEQQAERGKLPANALYYGYSITVGPDGKPEVREFGNVRPTMSNGRQQIELSSREPFVETSVDEKANQLKLSAEMPGVRKEDIKAEVTDGAVRIRAERGNRKYETDVSLNPQVDPSSAKATYNNGVLEVTFKLKSPPASAQKPKGTEIRID
jgi:HSP20 family protein